MHLDNINGITKDHNITKSNNITKDVETWSKTHKTEDEDVITGYYKMFHTE